MNAADVIPALEQVAGVLANSAATSGEFAVAAELSLAAVSALDDALAGHQASKRRFSAPLLRRWRPLASTGSGRVRSSRRSRLYLPTVATVRSYLRGAKLRCGSRRSSMRERATRRRPRVPATKRGNLSQRRRSEPMSSRSDLQNIPLWSRALLPCFGLTYSSRDSARAPTAGCRCGDRMSVSSEQFVYRECSLRRSA